MNRFFQRFSEGTANYVGTWWAFILAVLSVVIWAVTGPLFGYSDTWQLVINTATTVVTFWLVFIIQYTQNRDNRAIHLKLDELLRALPEARTAVVAEHLEQAADEVLEATRTELDALAEKELEE